jgi:hypothetical protein
MTWPRLPANQEGTEPIMPTVRAFNLPAPGSTVHAADQWGLTSTTDVGGDAPSLYAALDVRVIVPLVQATVQRSLSMTGRVPSGVVQGR